MALSRDARARYARQISLPEIGEQGQLRLGETRVRCGHEVAALYLERAGLDVKYSEAHDGHNWENWRDRLREGLSWLYPGPLWMVYE